MLTDSVSNDFSSLATMFGEPVKAGLGLGDESECLT